MAYPNFEKEIDETRRRVLDYLKPFQRETVLHVDRLFSRGIRRVLVADEVGLGKTLVARGVVGTTAALRIAEGDDLFKVAYVCSNASIVNQNLAKLSVSENLVDQVKETESRLSMQHFFAYINERKAKQDGNFIQLIPLTPETSFNVTGGQGTVNERALIFATLRRHEAFANLQKELEELFICDATQSWPFWKQHYEELVGHEAAYLSDMQKRLQKSTELLRELAAHLHTPGSKHCDRELIGRIRREYALLSIENLNPDLVVMDEFQRFRDLLDSSDESDMGIIASKFLRTEGRENDPPRVLLLSATPFKPFRTEAESELNFNGQSDNDFLDVAKFLSDGNERKRTDLEQAWSNYGVALSQYINETDGSALLRVRETKEAAETELRGLMARTERDGLDEYGDIIHDCSQEERIVADEKDIAAQLTVSRLANSIGIDCAIPIEYAESCPFVLSFLKGYKLRDRFHKSFYRAKDDLFFKRANHSAPSLLWIRKSDIESYQSLPFPNSRFRKLLDDIFYTGASSNQDASSLLWVPPSRPYYGVSVGPYVGVDDFSKTLVFSSWTMVPRMMATLISYEDERRSITEAYGKQHYFSYFDKNAEQDAEELNVVENEARRLPSNRLRLSDAAGKGAALLMYPSTELASCVEWPQYPEEMDLTDLVAKTALTVKSRFRSLLADQGYQLDNFIDSDGRIDASWYIRAVTLMDGASNAEAFFCEIERDESLSSAERHLAEEWRECALKPIQDMGTLPTSFFDTLAAIAIASPAICAMRTFNLCQKGESSTQLLGYHFATAFVRKANTPAGTLAVDSGLSKVEERYSSQWSRVLWYCAFGNLQSVLDEYGHLLDLRRNADAVCHDMIGDNVSRFKGPSLYTMHSHYDVDTLSSFRANPDSDNKKTLKLRTGFAAAFLEDEGGNKSSNHRENMRRAFNSPFRPFVLASTSIGQEGLDFHTYCRKIVHWNLPSNPIDLEQREGRINRYENMAIRQNLSQSSMVPYNAGEDLWEALFEDQKRSLAAEMELQSNSDNVPKLAGLAPYWGLPSYSDGSVKIERHTYLRRYGVAEQRYERLINSLILYRAVLGQPRQEELLSKLSQMTDGDTIRSLFLSLAPFNHSEEIEESDYAEQ